MIITEIKSAVMDDNIGTFYLKTEQKNIRLHVKLQDNVPSSLNSKQASLIGPSVQLIPRLMIRPRNDESFNTCFN